MGSIVMRTTLMGGSEVTSALRERESSGSFQESSGKILLAATKRLLASIKWPGPGER